MSSLEHSKSRPAERERPRAPRAEVPTHRGYGLRSPGGREVTELLHLWNFLEICPLWYWEGLLHNSSGEVAVTASRGRGWGPKLASEEEAKRNQVLSSSWAEAQTGSHRPLPEALPPGLPCWLLPPSRHALPPRPPPPVLWSDFEVRSSGIPRVAIWAEEAPPQNKAHGPMPPPLGGSPSVGTASGSRSSQSHFRDEEAEAQAGEASRRGASCSQRGRWNRTHSHVLGCAVTGLFPFSCGRSSSGIWLCPLQGWLGGAM